MIGRSRYTWPFVDVRTVLAVHAALVREERRLDTYRIMTRADVDLPALRRRMLHGTAPRTTMIDQVAPIAWAWGKKR